MHPNIKAFITHGGLMGTQEAIACGVPMIGIPLFADQFMNIDAYVARNIAVRVDIGGITEEIMDTALQTVLWDPLYRFAKSFSLYLCSNVDFSMNRCVSLRVNAAISNIAHARHYSRD